MLIMAKYYPELVPVHVLQVRYANTPILFSSTFFFTVSRSDYRRCTDNGYNQLLQTSTPNKFKTDTLRHFLSSLNLDLAKYVDLVFQEIYTLANLLFFLSGSSSDCVSSSDSVMAGNLSLPGVLLDSVAAVDDPPPSPCPAFLSIEAS